MESQGANMGILKEILNRFGTLIPKKNNKFGKHKKDILWKKMYK